MDEIYRRNVSKVKKLEERMGGYRWLQRTAADQGAGPAGDHWLVSWQLTGERESHGTKIIAIVTDPQIG
jgi:hypothetical protein